MSQVLAIFVRTKIENGKVVQVALIGKIGLAIEIEASSMRNFVTQIHLTEQ